MLHPWRPTSTAYSSQLPAVRRSFKIYRNDENSHTKNQWLLERNCRIAFLNKGVDQSIGTAREFYQYRQVNHPHRTRHQWLQKVQSDSQCFCERSTCSGRFIMPPIRSRCEGHHSDKFKKITGSFFRNFSILYSSGRSKTKWISTPKNHFAVICEAKGTSYWIQIKNWYEQHWNNHWISRSRSHIWAIAT